MPRSISRSSSPGSGSTGGGTEGDLGGPDDILEATLQAAEKLRTLLDCADENLNDKVEEIKSELSVEIDKLARLRRALPTKDDESTDSGESTESIRYSCTSELRLVPWKEASSLERVAREHVAIQIPSTQPTLEDLNPSKRHKKQDASADSQREAASERSGSEPTVDKRPFRRQGLPRDSHPLEELPDRIRICSLRLAMFLDHSIHDGSLNRGDGRIFVILRPFKFLVEKGDDIREELARLEQVWESRFPGVTGETDDSIYKADEASIYYRHGEIVNPDALGQNELMGLIKDMRCLIAFMDGYIAPSLKMGEIDQVYFSDLWFVFTARSLIYMRDKKVPQKVWKVIQRTGGHYHHDTDSRSDEDERTARPAGDRGQRGGRHPFVIDCFHLDYDGMRYVQTYTRVYIDYFEGCQPLASLPVMPIRVAEEAGWIDRGAVVARGREFASCTRPQHKHYVGRHQILRPNGLQLHERDEQVPENAARYPEWIESEVMVDFERALQEMPGWRPGLDELKLFRAAAPTRRNVDKDTAWDSKLSAQVTYEEWEKCQRWDKERTGPSEEDDLLLLPDRVFAFVFRTRKWACLKLGRDSDGEEMLREKKCRPEPWNDLQLPDGHKRLVQSLIESHSSKEGPRSLHFDLVRAKGKGVTILLHGVPGVGKTSTAECAAEANNRPLLPITCGDLGATAREVEKKLEEAFQLAQLWSCVLLLDEADIFLAQRNESDIQRNALVSVFLRVLEYYEGILFLTTNRVGVFDEAFKSRIHLPLYYPPLEWKYTKKIWHTHLLKLDRSGLFDVDVEDILAYAETFFEKQSSRGSKIGPVWNGRQIRNAFQSAVALAGYKRGHGEGVGVQRIRIDREHFERVSKVSNEFNHYIYSIKSANDADKAERLGIRLDTYQVDETIHLKQHHAAPAPMGGVGGAGGGGGGGGGGVTFGFPERLANMAAAQNNPPLMNNNNNNQFQGFTNTGFQSQQGIPNNSFSNTSFSNNSLSNQQRMMPMQQHHHFQNQQLTMANSFSTQQPMQAGFTAQQPIDPNGFPGQQAMPTNFTAQQPYGQEGVGQQAPYSQP